MDIQNRLKEELYEDAVRVPGGSYSMGSGSMEDERPVRSVFVDDFLIGKTLITNKEFSDFLNSAGVSNETDGTYKFINTLNGKCKISKEGNIYRPEKGYERHPVTYVNWYGAYAFCLWLDGRLPYEAEWEKAARGGLEGQTFPWGEAEPDENLANFGQNVGDTTPVGSYPPNGYGIFDISGNVWEWCMDWYNKDYCTVSDSSESPDTGTEKVIRGGSFSYGPGELRCARRNRKWPRMGSTNVGFRIVFK